jgi:hypothetical protein
MECVHCKLILKSKYILKTHLTNNKACLKLRGLTMNSKFLCIGCNTTFMNKANLTLHFDSCKKYILMKVKEEHDIQINKIREEKNLEIQKIKDEKSLEIHKIKCENIQSLSDLTDKFEKEIADIKASHDNFIKDMILSHKEELLFKKSIDHDEYIKLQVCYEHLEKQHEKTITKLEQKISQSDKVFQDIILNRMRNEAVIDIELDENSEKDINENESIEYKLQPLDLGNDMYIESREDGYINITNLCKAGGKKFNHWNTLDRTKAYLKALSNDTGIPASLLVTHQTGLGSNQATWVHPYVAINVAQWISPQFDVKISSWIYEVMLTGKIDISKTKSFQQLRLENKEQKIKIQYLTKKYVKSQPRIQYTEQNVIYILTTPSHKKEGKYILGKATNLTNRLSVYNKTDEHEVVYYQSCGDEETMSIVEQFVFQRLKDYREQANRERFILPEEKTIDLFIDVIKKTIG